ncbi:MAG: flagellar biosynthetic protein FliO [Ignavibacteriales bacterium]
MLQVIQALFFLVVVAGLAYVAARFLGARAMRFSQGRAIRLLEMVSLGPRKHACIVSVGDRAFLLGVTDQSVSKIAEIPSQEVASLWPADYRDGGPAGGEDFMARLMGLLGKPGEGRKR